MTSTNAPGKTKIIDVHSHIYPECYLGYLESREAIPRVIRHGGERLLAIFPEEMNPGGGRAMGPGFWDLDEKLAFMDRSGFDRSVVSLGNPWFNPLPDAEGDAVARDVNIELAACLERSGGRIVAMGALPGSSVKAAAGELRFIAAAKGLVGVSAGPHIAGLALDSPLLDVFWAELVHLDLPLFIHPENGVGGRELQGYGLALPISIDFPIETTMAVTRLVFGGVLERYPGLRILLAHGGGTLPYLSGRMDAVWRTDPTLNKNLPKPPSYYLERLYYDALVYSTPALDALTDLAGPERIMFGTDHPFEIADPWRNLQAIDATLGGTPGEAQVMGGSARDFFKI